MKKRFLILLYGIAAFLGAGATPVLAGSTSLELTQFAKGTTNFAIGGNMVARLPWEHSETVLPPDFTVQDIDALFHKILKKEFADKIGITPLTWDELMATRKDKTQPLRTDVVIVKAHLFLYSGAQFSPPIDQAFGFVTLEFQKFDETSPYPGLTKSFVYDNTPELFALKKDKNELMLQLRGVFLRKLHLEFVKILCSDKLTNQCAGKLSSPSDIANVKSPNEEDINRPQ